MSDSMSVPMITLNSGIRVANFSSPHPFTFTTGEILPACSPERANALLLKSEEKEIPHPGGWTDIELSFSMSDEVHDALVDLIEKEEVDIIIVPLPVMLAVKEGLPSDFSVRAMRKIRSCRMADRVKKTVYGDRFCI